MKTTIAIALAVLLLGTSGVVVADRSATVAGHGDVEALGGWAGHGDVEALGGWAGHGDVEALGA